MLPAVDFDNTASVAAFVQAKYAAMFEVPASKWLDGVFSDIDDLFAGRSPAYAAIDLHYHNLRHTLMATVCMAMLLEGRHISGADGRLKARDFELAIAAVLLHDTGYIKLKGDTAGTGAKYTFCHILRSCAYAASYLAQEGVTDVEIENVLSAIDCTGPLCEIGRLRFRDQVGRFVGCALATSDYIGQLADPLYPDKLGELYLEFRESDDFSNVPVERRLFKSEADLVVQTPDFWHKFVKPKLEKDFQAVYRYLARPVLSGRNDYMDAVEANFAKIVARNLAAQKAGV
ncbi:MAG TPA: HD domain-containing protein [Opitutaceae bacterium]